MQYQWLLQYRLFHYSQEAFEVERRDRLEREGKILKQLGEHEQEVALRFEQERVSMYIQLNGSVLLALTADVFLTIDWPIQQSFDFFDYIHTHRLHVKANMLRFVVR